MTCPYDTDGDGDCAYCAHDPGGCRVEAIKHDPAMYVEYRPDKPYDEHYPSTLIMPNGSKVCSLSRPFNGAALREVDKLIREKAFEDQAAVGW